MLGCVTVLGPYSLVGADVCDVISEVDATVPRENHSGVAMGTNALPVQ